MEKREYAMNKCISLLLVFSLLFTMNIPCFASETEGSDPTGETQGTVNPDTCSHSFGSWGNMENGHSRTCTICGVVESMGHSGPEGTVTKQPTCTEEGEKVTYCAICGLEMKISISNFGHSYRYERLNAEKHNEVCKDCADTRPMDHIWDGGVPTVQATCSSEGTVTYTCICGETRTEVAPKKPHSYSEWSRSETLHSRTCGSCGFKEEAAHSWYEETIVVNPTCASEGGEALVCLVCEGILITKILPKLTTHTYDNGCDPECNVCAATRKTEHTFSSQWSKNSSGHWHVCTKCSGKDSVQSHIPGPAATETSEQLCLTCGYVMMSRKNHKHEYSLDLSYDEEGHWYACSGCTEEKDYGAHEYDNSCDPECNTCGYINQKAHSFGGSWQMDETGHWNVCSACTEKSEIQEHIPGEPATEEAPQLCQLCGFVLANKLEHTHSFKGEWQWDESGHWQLCHCQEASDTQPHLWDGGQKLSRGEITYTCQECDAVRVEDAPGAPWWVLPVLVLLVCGLIGTVVVLIITLRRPKGKYRR